MRDFTFVVRHRAAPQGSKDIQHGKSGRPFLVESSKAVKPFRTAIKRAATDQLTGLPHAQFTGPVLVGIVFEFRQAKSNVDDYPTGQNIGDIDKLTRAVLDGLTEAKVIEDDSLVVGWLGADKPSKLWGPEDRVTITVRSVVSLTPSIVDFAEQGGRPLDAWQRLVLYEAVRARNPFDHPSGRQDHLLTCYDAECPGCYKAPTVKPVSLGPCVGCGEGDEGNHSDGACVLGGNGA